MRWPPFSVCWNERTLGEWNKCTPGMWHRLSGRRLRLRQEYLLKTPVSRSLSSITPPPQQPEPMPHPRLKLQLQRTEKRTFASCPELRKRGCIGITPHMQHRRIQQPVRHSVPRPTPKHTDKSQHPPVLHNQELLKKGPGVCRGARPCAPLRFPFSQKNSPYISKM